MARKPNYDFEKRKKEQERKARQEAKREERQRRKVEGDEISDDDLAGLGIVRPVAPPTEKPKEGQPEGQG